MLTPTTSRRSLPNVIRLPQLKTRLVLHILACWARNPRRGADLLKQSGITIRQIAEAGGDYLRLIAIALKWGGKKHARPIERTEIAQFAKALLIRNRYWDQADERNFVTGAVQWGPGPLVALLTRGAEGEHWIPRKAHQLRRLERYERRLRASFKEGSIRE